MNYVASITDFFKSPKWTMNMLLGGVCCLIPVVGPMVYLGWLITGTWCRQDERYETFPDFDFNRFGKYLERGLWPTVVGLAIGVVLVPVMLIVVLPVLFIPGILSHDHDIGLLGVLGLLLIASFFFVLMAAVAIVLPPVYLRAARMQDFMPSFNIAYVKRFASVMWKDSLIVYLFAFGAGFVVEIPAFIPCLGMLFMPFCMALLLFMHLHLGSQLYKLFVSRGGDQIPLSPKLTEEPAANLPPPAMPLPPP